VACLRTDQGQAGGRRLQAPHDQGRAGASHQTKSRAAGRDTPLLKLEDHQHTLHECRLWIVLWRPTCYVCDSSCQDKAAALAAVEKLAKKGGKKGGAKKK
jgi:hypothetical protein